jgi:hypothetical protein
MHVVMNLRNMMIYNFRLESVQIQAIQALDNSIKLTPFTFFSSNSILSVKQSTLFHTKCNSATSFYSLPMLCYQHQYKLANAGHPRVRQILLLPKLAVTMLGVLMHLATVRWIVSQGV